MDIRRSTRITDEQGFSLVEALVAAVLSLLVGAVMVTIIQMNSNGTMNGALNTMIQMQYETVVSDICEKTRFADVVLGGGEAWPAATNAAPIANTNKIMLYNTAGAVIGGYQIVSTTTLQEYDLALANWKNFHVGSKDVTVTAGSGFSLTGNRQWLTLNINVSSTFMTLTATSLSKQELFLCRN